MALAFILIMTALYFSVNCGYPPTGDEVQAGSVLLPASRRGRYLANIVRRQAVDGTGIKFNKDADRMNAEAKKKVDVLSEELLPYIIAEQERRTTLHKRVMTAIQNGEKGVTIAEMRNKPPLLIRKGLMYRCPANRAPKEPDGSGMLMCEDDIVPTQVMYDSCLSAEDKELYNADSRYFFCNRHKVEGPDLPRNGSTVIGCAPIERTSLNYTTSKCTLEDTDDIVVHYRYYPDRTYKFITELDPDREVCDHWNPCQIGYIFSLPSRDQATPATELWHDSQEKFDEYERDEIIPAVPEDSNVEAVHPSTISYTSSARKVPTPNGYEYIGTRMKNEYGIDRILKPKMTIVQQHPEDHSVQLTVILPKFGKKYYSSYYAVFKSRSGKEKQQKFLEIVPSAAYVKPVSVQSVNGQKRNSTRVLYICNRCRLLGILLRATDNNVYNVNVSRYRIKETNSHSPKAQQYIEIDMNDLKPQDFGDYFAIIQNGDNAEERVKILTIHSPEEDMDNEVTVQRLSASVDVGGHFDRTLNFTCKEDCNLTDILCNGDSVVAAGRVSFIPVSKMISFNFPRFEDSNSCVYVGFFSSKDRVLKKVLAVIDNNSPTVSVSKPPLVPPPKDGEQFEQEVPFNCDDCSVEKVFVDGLQLDNNYRKSGTTSVAFYVATSTSISIRITAFKACFAGVYQAVFKVREEFVTKTIMEIGKQNHGAETATSPSDGRESTTSAAIDLNSMSTTSEESSSATPTPGDSSSPASGEPQSTHDTTGTGETGETTTVAAAE